MELMTSLSLFCKGARESVAIYNCWIRPRNKQKFWLLKGVWHVWTKQLWLAALWKILLDKGIIVDVLTIPIHILQSINFTGNMHFGPKQMYSSETRWR